MKIIRLSLFIGFAINFISLIASGQNQTVKNTEYIVDPSLPWSQRMAETIMYYFPQVWQMEEGKAIKWAYTKGLACDAFLSLWKATGNRAYFNYAKAYADTMINKDGVIYGYKISDYNIDNINPGKMLFELYAETKDYRYETALKTLRRQFDNHPRTTEGGFWHKKVYPHQMWLDGLYMGAPFYAHYGKQYNEPGSIDDAIKWVILMEKKSRDSETGLLYHAWDESKGQKWADKNTGLSPHFWGRGMGWYAMALVDILDYAAGHPEKDKIVQIIKRTAESIVNVQDKKAGVWFQVLDKPDGAGNYLEGSGSAMFTYFLLKAVKKGYIDSSYLNPARKAYQGFLDNLIKKNSDGRIVITPVCAGAGLGGNPYRDGSYEYYINERKRDNDPKAIGPFIMASILYEELSLHTEIDEGWKAMDGILKRIQAPVFPRRQFVITDFGAKADGKLCTEAFRKAITACNKAGGGRVLVPKGTYLTGAIHLLSNVELHVSEGATILFSTNPKDYLPVVHTRYEGCELFNYSPLIYAYKQENIAISGKGTLDGQASNENWWGWARRSKEDMERGLPSQNEPGSIPRLHDLMLKGVPSDQRIFGDGSYLRPNFVQPYLCKNILIEGITIRRPPMWMLHPVLSENIIVRGVKLFSPGAPNGDGCDPEASKDILIEGCEFNTGDDCIAIKSGRNRQGYDMGIPSENIIIRNCKMLDGHGGVVLGSEISGGVRNVYAYDCEMSSPNLDRALRLKSNKFRGGIVENIYLRDIRVGEVKNAAIHINQRYSERPSTAPVSYTTFRNIFVENMTCEKADYAVQILGLEELPIENVKIINCRFNAIKEENVLESVKGLVLKNVMINGKLTD